jgi:hypothetical protein
MPLPDVPPLPEEPDEPEDPEEPEALEVVTVPEQALSARGPRRVKLRRAERFMLFSIRPEARGSL